MKTPMKSIELFAGGGGLYVEFIPVSPFRLLNATSCRWLSCKKSR